jgi:heterodisulfide reductase subunit D
MANQDYTIRQLLEMEACTNCRICADVCPAVTAAGEGEISAVNRMKGLKALVKSRGGLLARLLGRKMSSEDLARFSGDTFRCTLCGNCQEVCPVGIQLKELWLCLRQDLVHSDAYPKQIDMIRDNLAASHNVFAEDNDERADWVEDMADPPDHGFVKEQAEVVYFTGCVAAYFPLAQKIPLALADIMAATDVDFTLMGEEEWCCGFPLLGAGLKEMFHAFRDQNLAAVRAKGAREVVFACPSCYQMWREHYAPGDLKISHATQFLLRMLRQGAIPLKPLEMTVTYHDPCDLGRAAREFDAPREAIGLIPGVRLVELPRNRENCLCCGGGGNLEMISKELSADIARLKIEEVLSTGARAVVTACQQCVRTMTTYVRRNKVALEVLDLTQLVQRALAKEGDR